MTFANSAPPPIPFDGVPVWGSDDDVYQQLHSDIAAVIPDSRIVREASGYELPITKYLVRVATAAALRALWDRKSKADACADATSFFDQLALSSIESVDAQTAHREISEQVPVIATGVENYRVLLEQWPAIVNFVEGSDTLRATCRIM
jgi:hypothetical protein